MILEFNHVTGTSKKYALQDINFSLEAGYIMGLAGKNGAGKSTLLDYIMNPRLQYTGEIKINGVNIRDNHRYMMNKLGFISDNNGFPFASKRRRDTILSFDDRRISTKTLILFLSDILKSSILYLN